MDDRDRSSSDPSTTASLERRTAALTKVAVVTPVTVAEALLIASLFLPFITTSPYGGDPETVNLAQLGLALFGAAPSSSSGTGSGGTDALGVLFGVAFLGLFVVMLCVIVALLVVGRGAVPKRASAVFTTFGVLLAIGAIGAWSVIGLGSGSESPWLPETASFTLLGGTLFAALVLFFPAFRTLWRRD